MGLKYTFFTIKNMATVHKMQKIEKKKLSYICLIPLL